MLTKYSLLVLTSIGTALFSPMVAFYLCIYFLLIFTKKMPRGASNQIGYICAYSGSVMIASRRTFEPSDDFSHYYDAYLNILDRGWQAITIPYGTEIGLPFYYWVLSWTGISHSLFPMFAVVFLCSALYVYWLDKFGSLNFPPERYATMLAISLLFYGFLSASLISRQMISLSIILFAISTYGIRSLFLLVLAMLFHQASIFIYILFKYAERLSLVWIFFIISLGILFLIFFSQITEFAIASEVDFFRITSKFSYYLTSEESFVQSDISGLKFVLLSLISSIFASRYMPAGWAKIIFIVTILYILFLPFALVSLRTFLFFVAVFSGYIVTFLAFRIGWNILTLGAVLYSVYIILKPLSLDRDYPFLLWDKFEWMGALPMYYFLHLK
jgi:hypothetical protein